MLLRKLLVVLGIALTSSAYAGEQFGKVSGLIVRSNDGLHYFWLEGTSHNKPACATNTYWMIADENSTAGKAQLSIILSAQAQQKPIKVVGTGTCSRWRDGEDVNYIQIQ